MKRLLNFVTFIICAVALASGGAAIAADDNKAEPGKAENAKQTAKKDKKDKQTVSLFDHDKLGKWESINFGGEGDVHVSFEGLLTLEMGSPFTGVLWKGEKEKLPTSNYEISLEARKDYGNDFFCGLTFPVKDDCATFICGGWGGSVTGISSINDLDASENETTDFMNFEDDRWYKIRVRVTDDHLTGWIDDKQVFDVELENKHISLRMGAIEMCAPLGIANFDTRTQLRKIQLRKLGKKDLKREE